MTNGGPHEMSNLAAELDEARARVDLLERRAAAATCAELGRHDWQSTGGANCGCENGFCSVPVNICSRCKDCDYGENADAKEIRLACHAEHWTTHLARRAGYD